MATDEQDVRAIDLAFSMRAAGPTGATADSTMTDRPEPQPAKRFTVGEYGRQLEALIARQERRHTEASSDPINATKKENQNDRSASDN